MSIRAGSNVKIEPVKVWFANQFSAGLEFLQDASATYNNKYFLIDGDGTNYYVWFNYNATGVDPAVAGRTPIPVALTVGETKASIAAGVITALNAVTGLKGVADARKSSRLLAKVLSYNVTGALTIGTMTTPILTITAMSTGFFQDLGFSDGDLDLKIGEKLVDIKTHQLGDTIVAAIRNGLKVDLAVSLKELTEDNYARLIDNTGGGTYTSGGNSYRGYGTGQNSTNALDKASRLILHPVRLADNSNVSDLCAPLAYPLVDSINFSGEKEQMMKLTFQVYRDEFMDHAIDTVFFGDHTKI